MEVIRKQLDKRLFSDIRSGTIFSGRVNGMLDVFIRERDHIYCLSDCERHWHIPTNDLPVHDYEPFDSFEYRYTDALPTISDIGLGDSFTGGIRLNDVLCCGTWTKIWVDKLFCPNSRRVVDVHEWDTIHGYGKVEVKFTVR